MAYIPYVPPGPFLNQRQKAKSYFNPYMMEEPENPATGGSSLEPYLGSAAIEEQLKQYRRDSLSQGLLQAGGAILAAPDLSSGIGAGAQAFAGPLGEYQQARRELPTQAALSRYQIEGTDQERATREAEEARRAELHPYDVEEAEEKQGNRELRTRGLEATVSTAEAGSKSAAAKASFDELLSQYDPEMVGIAVAKAAQELSAGNAAISRTEAETKTENELRDPRSRLINAQADSWVTGVGHGGGGGTGDLTAGQQNTAMKGALTQALGFMTKSGERDAAWLTRSDVLKGGAYESAMAMYPREQWGAIDPDLVTLQQIQQDLQVLDDISLEERWGNDPVWLNYNAWLDWKDHRKEIEARKNAAGNSIP